MLTTKTARRRITTVGALAGACALLCASPAFAHVSVNPGEAEQGGYATVNFKVPNERDNASTIKLEVTLPTDHPLASVMPQPVPGWDVEVTKAKLDKPIELHGKAIDEAPSKITWSGGKIEPGTFQQFPVSMGRLPEDAGQLVFKTLQTYDNKEVVRWIEEPEEGGEEPESPAPVLKLIRAEATDAVDTAGDKSETSTDGKAGKTENADSTAAESGDSSDTTARALGIAGIVIGLAGVAFGVLAGRRTRA